MRNTIVGMAVFLLLLVGATAPRAGDAIDLESALRAVEEAFAETMERRNLEAFAEFLHEDAVFSTPGGPLRGKVAVVEAWSAYFEGEDPPFSWAPAEVVVSASGDLGLNSGPVYDPSGKRVGTFNSVWRRDASGDWKILFDRGCPACECPE